MEAYNKLRVQRFTRSPVVSKHGKGKYVGLEVKGPWTTSSGPRELKQQRAQVQNAFRSVSGFSTTSPGEGRRATSSRYKMSAPCSIAPYLPGRGRLGIKKPSGLDNLNVSQVVLGGRRGKCTTGVEHVDQSKRRKLDDFAENLVQEAKNVCKNLIFTMWNTCFIDDNDEYNENRRSDGKWVGSRSQLNGSYSDHRSYNGTYLLTRENFFVMPRLFVFLDWIWPHIHVSSGCFGILISPFSGARWHREEVVSFGHVVSCVNPEVVRKTDKTRGKAITENLSVIHAFDGESFERWYINQEPRKRCHQILHEEARKGAHVVKDDFSREDAARPFLLGRTRRRGGGELFLASDLNMEAYNKLRVQRFSSNFTPNRVQSIAARSPVVSKHGKGKYVGLEVKGPWTTSSGPRELKQQRAQVQNAFRSVSGFSTTSPGEGRRATSSRYKMSAPCSIAPYLPGRGRLGIKKPSGLGQWPALHMAGALAYHLPKWESGRHNLW
ncbi:hypothetical protein ZEAMMB73_Zm00001d003278 [Zea mays]|uniref:Uncharacterized protein n=1 Tax=Zea mays TaxID=4577 RepID=A0A1D6E8C4_MAIZE|nr:hypothetical protein ZEAMMB73_Zm00001d003278 [Zea mays]